RTALGTRPKRADSPFGFGLRWCIACTIFGGVNLLENLFLNHRVLEKIAGVLSNVLVGDPLKLRVEILLRRCRRLVFCFRTAGSSCGGFCRSFSSRGLGRFIVSLCRSPPGFSGISLDRFPAATAARLYFCFGRW